jgi:hypothetical protein
METVLLFYVISLGYEVGVSTFLLKEIISALSSP